MANIITRKRGVRDQIERHMKNSVEYSNPNLKHSQKKFSFPPLTEEERKRLENCDMYGNPIIEKKEEEFDHQPKHNLLTEHQVGRLNKIKSWRTITKY